MPQQKLLSVVCVIKRQKKKQAGAVKISATTITISAINKNIFLLEKKNISPIGTPFINTLKSKFNEFFKIQRF